MSHPLELQVDTLGNELIRVSMTRNGRTVAAFVSSHHLVEDKRRQLEDALTESPTLSR
jgi:hypothetical protein